MLGRRENMNGDPRLPTWAPRVGQSKIRRLYETDAKGIYDEELIDKVGYALLARCESFITANCARAGKLPCPQCARPVRRAELMRCPCGWELPWADYFKTIQHKQLSGARPVLKQFRDFVNAFPLAETPQEKVMLIDRRYLYSKPRNPQEGLRSYLGGSGRVAKC